MNKPENKNTEMINDPLSDIWTNYIHLELRNLAAYSFVFLYLNNASK